MEKQVLGLNINLSTALILILAPLLLSTIMPNVFAVTSVLNPTADTEISEGDPTGNFGGNDNMDLRRTSGQIERILIEFNMPTNVSSFDSAVLEIFYYNKFGTPVGERIDVYTLLPPSATGWTEMGATWNKYDGVINWVTAGGDFSTGLRSSNTVPAAFGFISFDVTAILTSFLNNGSTTINFFAKMQTEDAVVQQLQFRTRENVTHQPKLTLIYDTLSESGYIGGIPTASNFTITGGNSFIYVANVARSISINSTFFNVLRYSNTFGDAWAAVTLYTAPNNQPISRLNPLKAMWSDFVVIINGTNNLEIVFAPNIITLDNQFIAIALSVTEDMIINASNTNQTMYTYPVYAPYSIDYLNPDNDTLGIRFTWNMLIPSDIATGIDLSSADNTFDLLNSMNSLAVRLGFPVIMIYGGLFVVILFGTLIMIGNAKKESGDTDKLPPIIFSTFVFAILAFFTITNMLPFEIMIFAIVGISAVSGLFISKIILGNGE